MIKRFLRISGAYGGWGDSCFRNVCLYAILFFGAAGCGADIIVADEQVADTGGSDSSTPLTTDTVVDTHTTTNADTNTGTDTSTDIRTDIGTDTDTNADSDTNADTDTDTHTDTITDTNSDTETSADSDTSCPVLPVPYLMLSDNDAEAFSHFGEADITWTTAEGPQNLGAWQVDTRQIIHTSTGTQLYHNIQSEIAAGDHMVAEFRVRCRSSASGQCRAGMVIETSTSPWHPMTTYFFLTGPEWQFFQIPVVADAAFAADAARLTFRLGYENQSLDIYPSRLLNYGALDGDSRPECLPSSESSTNAPVFLTDAPPNATVDILYDYFIEMTGEVTGSSPSVVTPTGLPSWLTFDPAQNRLSGIPAYSDMGETSSITLTAHSGNQTATQHIDVAVTVDAALVGHWPLDETSGSMANDASGNGRNGTVVGDPAWLPDDGKNNGALRCDANTGEVDYVLLPSDAVTNTVQSGPHTLAAWVRMASIPEGTVASDNHFGYGILIKPGHHTGLWYDAGQHFRASYEYEGNSYALIGPVTAPGAYHHVAAVFDPEAGSYQLHVDGEVVASETLSDVDTYRDYGDAQWRIGVAATDASAITWASDMSVDDVRIYSKALNRHEIGSLADIWVY